MPTSIVFAGTPLFAAVALERLLAEARADGRFEVRAVLTQPDRPAGRGQRRVASPVKQVALAHGLPVLQPPTLKDAAAQAEVAALTPDFLVVAAYGLILPAAVLAIPRIEPLNIHGSLLPRWRGAAPIARAIEAGDRETGICIMRMEQGLDTGPVCLRRELVIADDDTAASLHDRLAALGADAIVDALDGLAGGRLDFEPQSDDGITYAHKLDKAEGAIDWTEPADRIAARIRAFDPAPGAHGRLASAPGLTLKLFAPVVLAPMAVAALGADAVAGTGARPGRVIAVDAEGVVLASGGGALRIGQLQRPGGRRLPAAAFLAGHRIEVGDRFIGRDERDPDPASRP